MFKKETITKLQAAERQLIVATQLYFKDSDIVSVHTLTAASYNIIRDLLKESGKSEMAIKDNFVKSYTKTNHKKVIDYINSFENFFKHANRDPNGVIEFKITEIMLIDAWGQYNYLTKKDLPEAGKALKIWVGGNVKKNTPKIISTLVNELRKFNKKEFYELFCKIYTTLKL